MYKRICVVMMFLLLMLLPLSAAAEELFPLIDEQITLNDDTRKTILDSGKSNVYSWSSSDKSIATVDYRGRVTARNVGTCVITALAKDGSAYTCTVTVIKPVTRVAIAADRATIKSGNVYQLKPVISPSNATDKTIVYTSSNEEVAAVDESGLVTGLRGGSATITAASLNGKKDTIRISVTQEVTVLSLADISVLVNKRVTLAPQILPEDATERKIKWSSSNTRIASVASDGKVTGRKAGTCVITATAQSGVTASCIVTVIQPVTEVRIDKSSATVESGKTYQIAPVIRPNDATDKTIAYTSSNETVASVDENGLVTALRGGSATITATATSGKKDTIRIYVTQKVTALSLADASVLVNKKVALAPQIFPEDATERKIKWTSSNTKIAGVYSDGKVIGRKAGTCVITATAQSGVTASCIVTVIQPVTDVRINKSSIRLEKDESYEIVPSIRPSDATDKSIVYTSSNEQVASVDENGVVTPLRGGTATITATATSGRKDSIRVSVIQEVTGLALEDNWVFIGRRIALAPQILPDDATETKLKWSSSNTKIAAVSSDGKVTGRKAGTCVITATAQSGVTASCTVTVIQPVTEVRIPESSVKIEKGKNYQIAPVLRPSNAGDKTVIYSSSNEAVASVDENGIITALRGGSATVTAMATSGKKDTVRVYVTQQVTALLLSDASVLVNKSVALVPQIFPDDATETDLKWTSSNTSVARVSASGKVTGRKAGTCVITATAQSGAAASCTVTVIQPVTSVVIPLSAKTVSRNHEYQLNASVRPSDATDKTLYYRSNNPAVASVDENGVVRGNAKGSATITAISENGKKDTIRITVESIAVKRLAIDRYYLNIAPGESRKLTPSFEPENASVKEACYSSSDTSVAVVDPQGMITAVGAGEAIITVTAADNPKLALECRVFVREAGSKGRLEGVVIGINPGHQDTADNSRAPLAPGSSKTAKKIKVGCAGIKTRRYEYMVNLEVGMMLRDLLEAEGATVIMTRTRHDVNLTNIERAQMLNEAQVDLALQLHCDSVDETALNGIMSIVKPNDPTSYAAAKCMMEQLLIRTGAKDRSVRKSDGYMSLNWSTTPTVLVEMGFMSNPKEDVLLSTPSYQLKLAEGMYEGIARYFGR